MSVRKSNAANGRRARAVDAQDEHGYTPLLIAVQRWDATRVRELIANGADPSAPARALATCRAYEKLGDAADAPKGPATLLHGFATGSVYPQGSDAPGVLAALLDCGLAIDAPNQDGSTALHVAVCRARREPASPEHDAVAALLARGADLHARDRRGRTPLAHATWAWSVQRLLDAGAKPDDGKLVLLGVDALRALLDAGADPRRQPHALSVAATLGRREIVELLLAHGAPTVWDQSSAEGVYRKSVLEDAIPVLPTPAHVEIVQLLLAAGTTELGGALHLAAAAGHAGLVELLLDRRTTAANSVEDLATALCAGARAGSAEVVATLLRAGATASDAALCAAAGAGSADTIALLLGAGARVEIRDENGDTPLMLAAKADSLDAVRALLRAGADPLARNAAGKTAATIARLSPAVAAELPRAPSLPRQPAPTLRVGDAVMHDKFGAGRVLRVDGNACIVAFADGTEHRLSSRFLRHM